MSSAGRRIATTALWLVIIFEALAMGAAGGGKFVGSHWQSLFVEWGYPVALSYLVGAAEVVGAILLLFPRLASYAAGGLAIIMVGAVVTQLKHPGAGGWFAAAVHLALVVVIGVARWPRRMVA